MEPKGCCAFHTDDHSSKGWWIHRDTSFAWNKVKAEETDFLLMFGNDFICHIGRSGRADEMVPKLVKALNDNKVVI
jgi:hypothetical protein